MWAVSFAIFAIYYQLHCRYCASTVFIFLLRLPLPTIQSNSTKPYATLHPVARAVLLACAAMASCAAAWGQSNDKTAFKKTPLRLRASPWLNETVPVLSKQQAATVLWGNNIQGQVDKQITVTGNAELRRPGDVLKADSIHYDQSQNMATAKGNITLNRQGNVFKGDTLQLQLDSYAGGFDNVRYQVLQTDGAGAASRVDFIDQKRSIIHDGTYSTCQACANRSQKNQDDTAQEHKQKSKEAKERKPAWYIKGKRIYIDQERDEGFVEQGALVFGGVPIIPVPRFGFPLSDARRSGFLPPTFNVSTMSGVEYSQPYYFNIAPNRDATLTSNVSSKRGIDLHGQFRYLEPNYHGQLAANFMPNDRKTKTNRWSYRVQHSQRFPSSDWGRLGLTIDATRVSDNTYWRDFKDFTGTRTHTVSERQLPSTVTLDWANGFWSAYIKAQRWQTLQLPAPDNIVPPFDKLPQVHARYARNNIKGFDMSLDLDMTRFQSKPALTGYPNGTRAHVYGKVSRPWLRPWGFLTPSVEFNAMHYNTDTAMPNGKRSGGMALPTLSVDSGLIFERSSKIFNTDIKQTLEPRLFYTYTPYKKQSHLPVYDSAAKSFNFASIFSSNPFTGADRIADNNSLTMGVTSRLYSAKTGSELARLSVAQRYRFSPRRVFLGANPNTQSSFSNILLEAQVNWHPHWSARASATYDQKAPSGKKIIDGRFGIQYAPAPYRVLSANTSYQANGHEQVDVGWQWPLNDLWGDKGKQLPPGRGQGGGRLYSIGRVYYSLKERRITDALLGLEYDACCWIGRIAWRRQQTQTLPRVVDNSVMLQIEFVGLSKIGTRTLGAFREHIPGYTPLRQPKLYKPSRFQRYD